MDKVVIKRRITEPPGVVYYMGSVAPGKAEWTNWPCIQVTPERLSEIIDGMPLDQRWVVPEYMEAGINHIIGLERHAPDHVVFERD